MSAFQMELAGLKLLTSVVGMIHSKIEEYIVLMSL